MSDWDRPRPFFILALMLCAIIALLAYKLPSDNDGWIFVKGVLIILAAGVGIWGITGLIEYFIWLTGYANENKYSVIVLDKAARLSADTAAIYQRHTTIDMIGIMSGELQISWRIRSSPVDIEWSFAQDFIKLSEPYYPHLAPIGKAYELTDNSKNAERQAAALVNLLVEHGLAMPGRGNTSATLLEPYDDITEIFGIEKG